MEKGKEVKKLLFMVLALVLVLPMLSGCFNKDADKEKVKANNNEGIVSDKKVSGLLFKKASLIYDKGTSTLTTEITNNTNATVYVGGVTISFLDKAGKEIVSILGYVGANVEPSETKILTSSVDQDLLTANSVKYTLVKQ